MTDAPPDLPQAAPLKPKFCRAALLGLLGFLPVMGFCVLSVPLAVLGVRVVGHAGPGGGMEGELHDPALLVARLSWLAVCGGLIPLVGMLWTTICGIAAIVQIRRAAGQITGLWLAVFDAVVFPIIILVVVAGALLVTA